METKKDAAAVSVFPPLVPAATVLLGVALDYILPLELPDVISPVLRYWIGGLVIAGAILGLGAWSVFVMRRSGQSENPYKPTFHIVERGPFRVTRNPMYLQMVIVCAGFAILLLNGWILLLTPACCWLLWRLAIRAEEAYLEEKFGDEYLNYKNRVRRWL